MDDAAFEAWDNGGDVVTRQALDDNGERCDEHWQRVRRTNRHTNGVVETVVHWSDQFVDCCDPLPVRVADGRVAPVYADEWGDLHGKLAQCGTCGTRYAAQFVEVEPETEET